MGHALAERLLAGGHSLTVWNRTPGKADDLVALGARPASTPAEAAGSELTLTSLADDSAVRAVVTRPDGAAAGLGDGVLADDSMVSPETTAQLNEAMWGRFLASPILGSPMAGPGGEATYLIGGPHEVRARARPAYETLADDDHHRYVGEDPTVASTLKLLSNYLLMTGIACLSEAVATALDDELIRDYFGRLRSSHRGCATGSTTSSPATIAAGSPRCSVPRTCGWPRSRRAPAASICLSPRRSSAATSRPPQTAGPTPTSRRWWSW